MFDLALRRRRLKQRPAHAESAIRADGRAPRPLWGVVSSGIRQVTGSDLRGSFETVLCLSSSVLEALDMAGITFTDETEGDEAGPTEWAALELDDGSQWLIVHPSSGEPEGNFLYVRAPVQQTTIARVAQRFLEWLQPTSCEVLAISTAWPPTP